jgi:hypothetical protein
MRTKHEDYGEPAYEKQPGDIYMTLQPGGNYTPTFRIVYDYGSRQSSPYTLNMPISGTQWGAFSWGSASWANATSTIQEKLYGEGSGQTIALEWDHSSSNEPYYIGSVAPEISILGDQSPGAGGD